MICLRLGNIRKQSNVSRAALAREMKIKAASLANYELCRAVVPYEIGREVCRRLDINQRWLAIGTNPPQPFFHVDPQIEAAIQGGLSFHAHYERHLKREIEARWARREANREKRPGGPWWLEEREPIRNLGHNRKEYQIALLTAQCAALMMQMDDTQQEIFFREMFRRSKELFSELFRVRHSSVDNWHLQSDNPLVRLTWNHLRKRLKKATAETGKQAAAAEFVGVNRSNLYRWVEGDREPGAEATFRLLEWVTAEEAKQQQSAASARTPATPKAQKKGSNSNETTRPSRRNK